MAGARLYFINAFDGAKIKRIGSEAVKSVGRHSQNFAGANLICCITDERRLRFFTVDLDHLHAHTSLQVIGFARVKITRELS